MSDCEDINVCLKSPDGKKFMMGVDPYLTIDEFQKEVEEISGVKTNLWNLSYKGKSFKDGNVTLQDAGFIDCCTVQMNTKVIGGIIHTLLNLSYFSKIDVKENQCNLSEKLDLGMLLTKLAFMKN
ncbi:unnamed protein product [Moneuplotes crassus]|uniref:Ubiquitin-like domain-containing protein n=1 Tax=Euplotes crassus TaxID=5936 RepID=A0AAD1Y0D8_EUPCR|nr:unnamed protein product [Moneuplotes crassus]